MFFDKFFANRVQYFEEMNTKYMNIICYRDEKHSYSWEAFRYITLVMLDSSYPKFVIDLKELYQVEVLKDSRKYVDKNMCELAYR